MEMRKKFDEIFEDCTKLGTKIKTDEYHSNGKHPIIDQGQEMVAGFTDLEDGLLDAVPAIVFGDHTRIIKYVDCPFFLGADGVKVLRSKVPNANYRYLYYALKNAKIPNTGYNRHYKWLKELEIEYPPIDQQVKTVKVLDKVESIIYNRQNQLQKLDELVKARFVEMFGGIHDSSLYPYVPVKELTHVISGGTPSRDVLEYWCDGTIPWVKTTELQNKIITEVDEHITSKGLAASSAKIVPPNTTLIAMYGQGKTRGMTGYLGISASTNQACACILPSPEINSVYIWKYFELSYDKLRNMAKGGNQPNLNGNMIKNFPVLVPPIKRQEEYVQFVNQVDKSKVAVQKSLDEAQLLFDSLMQHYFG